MDKLLITVNIGSTSKKYAVFRTRENKQEMLISLTIERDEYEPSHFIARDSFNEGEMKITEYEYQYTLAYLEQIIIGNGFASSLADVEAILMRIVAPGEFFQNHHVIDESYFAILEKAAELAPLHLALQQTEYDQMKAHLIDKGFAEQVKIWGISDSAFHKTLPEVATRYGIARKDAEDFGIRRFGYHGLSFGSIAHKTGDILGAMPEKMIVCHLGGGASVAAIKDGKSINTSMGMTPLEGLLMARRSGDIDPGALLALMELKGWGVDDARAYLNRDCGLLGVSGTSDDMRALQMRESAGDAAAKEAIDLFVHRIRHYIGAYMVELGGVDVIVFTGTIGERAYRVRARILEGLDSIGISFDGEKNSAAAGAEFCGFIESPESRTKIAVMSTDEFGEMVRCYLGAK